MKQEHDFQKIQIDHMNVARRLGNSFLQIKPGVLCTFDSYMPSNSWHFHNCFELCLVTEGAGCFYHDTECLPVKKGDIFIADPDVGHEISVVKKGETALETALLRVYHFSISIQQGDLPEKDCQEEMVLKRFLRGHDRVRAVQNKLYAHMEFLYRYTRLKNQSALSLECAIINTVLDCLSSLTHIRREEGKPQISSNIIDEALLYIARNLNGKISLEGVARSANTSKRNVQLMFRQHLNSSVTDYVNQRRMSVASSYLRMNFRIKDVGPRVGIEDPARFCRLFKKYYGVSPKQYQQSFESDGMTFAADVPERRKID